MVREQPPYGARVVLEPGRLAAHAEAHVRGVGGDVEGVEQPAEVGIVRLVEHDEAGVDADRACALADAHRAGVSSRTRRSLEHRHLVPARQDAGDGHARNPGADDGDPHRCGSRERLLPSRRVSPCPGSPPATTRVGACFRCENRSERGEEPKAMPGGVDLPPPEPLAGRGRIAVMVVVPPLAQGNGGEQRVVAAVVGGVVAPAPPAVGERVDAEGRVIEQHRRDREPPHEHLPGARAELGPGACEPAPERGARGAERDERQPVDALDQSQLRKPHPVTDPLGRGREALRGEKPQRVAEPPPAMSGRVRIVGRVRYLVMDSVMGRPPQRSPLPRRAAEHRHGERHAARGTERAVREVAVVEGGDEEHARDVQGGADEERHWRDPHHRDQRTGAVQCDERSGAQGIDAPTVRMDRGLERARVVEQPTRPMPQCPDHALPGTRGGPC